MDNLTQRAIKKYPHRAVDIAQSYDAKQIKCKEWLCDQLEILNLPQFKRIYIAGGWYGNILIPKLLELYPNADRVKLHDLDKEAVYICRNIYFKDNDTVRADVQDCTTFKYDSFVINTSCEHMTTLTVKSGSYVALQSNNYREVEDHNNCVDSALELADQYNVKDILFEGELEFNKYTRYMVIGRV